MNVVQFSIVERLAGMAQLLKTVDFFDLIKSKHHLTSDYALAKMLVVTAGLICKHRKKAAFAMADDLALRCADALKLDPCFVLMCVNCERAKSAPQKKVYERLAGLSIAYARELRLI